MTRPALSVVVVSWNSAPSLEASFAALHDSAAAADEQVEIVLVDNASDDDSVGVALRAGADRIVENPVNAGYVVAASQGIAVARGDWIMLANPDLTVGEDFVEVMLRAARSAPSDVACLVPDIRYAADPSIVNSRGIEVDVFGIPAESEGGLEGVSLVGLVDVFGPSSSGCLLRRSALADVGGLEPLYFAYLEDVDLGWRLRKRGYRSIVVPRALAVHEGSVSVGEGSWLKAFLVARNRRALFRLHGPHDLASRPLRALTEVGHASVQAVSGSGTASVRGRLAALRTRRYTRFLRASNRVVGIQDDAAVALAPRQTLAEALRRKRVAASLMRGAGTSANATRVTTAGGVASTGRGRRPDRLRVLVDATNLKPGQGGIRTYTIGLVQALAARPELSLVVVASVDDVTELGEMEHVAVSPRTRGVVSRALWRERNLASLARAKGVDVTLTPVPELPLRPLPVPSVIVVHDVGPLVAPAYYTPPQKLRFQAVLPRTCRAATSVVCVSHATLMGLHAATGIETRRCEVIGEGPQLLEHAARTPRADEPYVLYVGSLDARKNVKTLLDAVTLEPALPARLVVVGPVDTRAAAALRLRLERTGASDRIDYRGFVTTDALAELYAGAVAVALPSLYEGFGLPALEAMRAGAPVVASDIPSFREVAGDAALYVTRPVDAASWHAALDRVCRDSSLRENLAGRGLERVALFSWERVGERFSDLLNRVAHGVTTAHLSPTTSDVDSHGIDGGPAVPIEMTGRPER